MKSIPNYFLNFLKKIIFFAFVFSVLRICFLLFNNNSFPTVYFTDFLVGFWFDLITTAILFLPLLIIELFPNPYRHTTWFNIVLKTFYIIVFTGGIIMNIADIEYFKHTSTRSTGSTLTMLSYGNDLWNQLPSFFRDFWYLLILLIALVWLSIVFYHKYCKPKPEKVPLIKQLFIFIISAGLLVSLGRGWGLRPIAPINASKYTIDQNVPLVLNSAFTIIKSIGNENLDEKHYFDSLQINRWVNPIKQFDKQAKLVKPNIVLILLESFSVEYIGSINGDSVSYTPFIDELAKEGMLFTNCYANGKKSIDAVPSVISSIPKLMSEEFITSKYSTNKIESLPKLLNKLGYQSAFFHGATNGSMNFNQFAAKAQFGQYFGRTEYNDETGFDGTWGIFDHLFLPWTIDKMNEFSNPFFSTIFTISSHPPFTIPDSLKSQFNKGPNKMHDAVRYADYSLRLLFEKMKKQTWFDNTLFIVTADHTPASGTPIYFKEMGNMHIPLIFYHPTYKALTGTSEKIVSQIDILPSVLQLIGYDQPFFSFGSSVFSAEKGFSVSRIGNKYLIFGMQYFLVFENGKMIKMYHVNDRMQQKNLLKSKPETAKYLKNKLLAFIQQYNHALITNKMTVD